MNTAMHPTPPPSPPLKLQLDVFEGPLDVLLHLIREKDLDIFDIPVHQIADEFQQYVELAQTLDLERAGDYLSTAAELAYIKSRMLLPATKEDEDPRQELVERLLEHEQVQNVTAYLDQRKRLGRDFFTRGADPSKGLPPPPLPKNDAGPEDLHNVFDFLLRRATRARQATHQVRREGMSVRQRIVWICQQLRLQARMRFTQLLGEHFDRATLIVTFLALLELSRLRRIQLTQLDGDQDLALEAIDDLEEIPLHEVDTFSQLTSQKDDNNTTPTKPKA